MRIRNQISDNGNLCMEGGGAGTQRDTGPWREGEELNSEGKKTQQRELRLCVCVCRKAGSY